MVNKKSAVIVVLLVALVVVVWIVKASDQGEQGRIRRRLDDLTELLSSAGAKKGPAALLQLASLQKFFTEEVTVKVSDEISEISGRDNLVAAARVVLQHEAGMKVSFADITVALEPGERQAQINVTVLVRGVTSKEAKSIDVRELEIDLVRPDGDWLIDAVRPVEVLELD